MPVLRRLREKFPLPRALQQAVAVEVAVAV